MINIPESEQLQRAVAVAIAEGWEWDTVLTVMQHIVVTEADVSSALREFTAAKQRARDWGLDLNRAYNVTKQEQAEQQGSGSKTMTLKLLVHIDGRNQLVRLVDAETGAVVEGASIGRLYNYRQEPGMSGPVAQVSLTLEGVPVEYERPDAEDVLQAGLLHATPYRARPHQVVQCSCGEVLQQCRCLGPHDTVTVPQGCATCKGRS